MSYLPEEDYDCYEPSPRDVDFDYCEPGAEEEYNNASFDEDAPVSCDVCMWNQNGDAPFITIGKTEKQRKTSKAIIGGLRDYWITKGLFLSARINPSFADNSEYCSQLVDYLTRRSDLGQMQFWLNMSAKDKETYCKSILLADGSPLNLSINNACSTAEICVVFCGCPLVSCSLWPEPRMQPNGRVFGEIGLFENPTQFEDPNYQCTPISVSAKNGSVLRLPFRPFFEMMVTAKKQKVKVVKPVSLQEDSDIPEGYVLTEMDRPVYAVRQRARSCIPLRMLRLMARNDIIGMLGGDKGSEYITQGGIGRRLDLSADMNVVYIVMEGSIRLQLEKVHEKKKNSVVCYRKGEKSMRVKGRDISILSMEPGSVLSLNKELFSVGQEPIEYPLRTAAKQAAAARAANASLNTSSLPTHTRPSTGMVPSPNGSGGADGDAAGEGASEGGAGGGNGGITLPEIVSRNSGSNGGKSNAKPTISGRGGLVNGVFYAAKPKNAAQQAKKNLDRALEGAAEMEAAKMEQRKLENIQREYKLYFVFCQPTTYLTVPTTCFRKMMKEAETLEEHSYIDSYINSTRPTVLKTIEKCLPLIQGNFSMESIQKESAKEGDIEAFELSQSRFDFNPTKAIEPKGLSMLGTFLDVDEEQEGKKDT